MGNCRVLTVIGPCSVRHVGPAQYGTWALLSTAHGSLLKYGNWVLAQVRELGPFPYAALGPLPYAALGPFPLAALGPVTPCGTRTSYTLRHRDQLHPRP